MLPSRKTVNPEEPVDLTLTRQEIELIREETYYPETDDLLGIAAKGGIRLNISLVAIEDMQGYVAAAGNHCENKQLQKRLDRLFQKLETFLNRFDW